MRRILAAVLLGLSMGPARAKPATEKEPDAKQLRQMYEDVAVFRSLLNRSIAQSYGLDLRGGLPGASTGRQMWTDPKTHNSYYLGVQYPIHTRMDSVHGGSFSCPRASTCPVRESCSMRRRRSLCRIRWPK